MTDNLTHVNSIQSRHETPVGVYSLWRWGRFGLTLAALVVLWSLHAPRPVYASDCGGGPTACIDPLGTVTSVPVTVKGTCDSTRNFGNAFYDVGVRVVGQNNSLDHSLGFNPMSSSITVTQNANAETGRSDWELEWSPPFNGTYKIQQTCYGDADDVTTGAEFTVDYLYNYSNFQVTPDHSDAGWIAMVVASGSQNITPVTDGDLILVIEDTNASDEADAESVDEVHPAGREFKITYDTPHGKTPYALYCMADCQSWSYSGNTMTANVQTVRQVKSNGDVRESALGFLTSFSPDMKVVEGSHFSGIGVHYSDMSSTDPSVITKRSGYSVDGFTGHTATFKMYAPDRVLEWMGIDNPMEQWTAFLGDDVSSSNITKTRVAGAWIMEFTFEFASNKKPGAGPPPSAEPNYSGYWAEKFSGVVFDDYEGKNVSTGGNSFGGGADYITFSGDTICINPPMGFSATGLHVNQSTWYPGASCYTSSDGARVDFGISQDPTPALVPTVAPTATPSGQTQGTLTAAGGTVSNAGEGVTLTFASGSVPDGATATIRPLASGDVPAVGTGFSLVDTVVEIVVRDASGVVVSDFSANPVRMCFDYTAAQLLSAGGDTANLEVVRNPGLTDESSITSNRAVDSAVQQICVDVTQFSTWTVAARVPTALPVTGSGVYQAVLAGVVAAVILLSGGLILGWRRRQRS